MIVIGLTGSIGMGKSATVAMFQARGVPVHDADAAVHAIYEAEGQGPIAAQFPESVIDGRVTRAEIARRVLADPAALARLEELIHPLVRERERAFLAAREAERRRIVLLDIPLLLETGRALTVDLVVVATARPDVQEKRVLARPGMDPARFAAIRARQMPDPEKRRRAHALIETSAGFAAAERQVDALLRAIAALA